MRTVTFADKELCAWMNKTFVLAWYDVKPSDVQVDGNLQPVYSQEEIAAYPEGGGGANIRAIFCSPEGVVRHGIQGWWPAASFREECNRGLECATSKSIDAARDIRAKATAELTGAAKDLAAKNPEEMRKPVRESAIARKIAALRLRASWIGQVEGAIGQEAAAVLADWQEDLEGRVIK